MEIRVKDMPSGALLLAYTSAYVPAQGDRIEIAAHDAAGLLRTAQGVVKGREFFYSGVREGDRFTEQEAVTLWINADA